MNAASQRQLTPWLVALVLLLGAVLLALLAALGRGVGWDAPRPSAPLPPAGRPADLPSPVPRHSHGRPPGRRPRTGAHGPLAGGATTVATCP